jgi:hypothetical protein
VHEFDSRTGVRIGGGHRAQLVQPHTADPLPADDERERRRRIDALYREWSRDRADVDVLRRLQEVIARGLDGAPASAPAE